MLYSNILININLLFNRNLIVFYVIFLLAHFFPPIYLLLPMNVECLSIYLLSPLLLLQYGNVLVVFQVLQTTIDNGRRSLLGRRSVCYFSGIKKYQQQITSLLNIGTEYSMQSLCKKMLLMLEDWRSCKNLTITFCINIWSLCGTNSLHC